MKKLGIALVLAIILLSLFTTPVLAGDPPDTQVDVGVVTSGDVDLNVGINAGGDVSVSVGGVDMSQTAATAQAAYNKAFSPTNFMWDYGYYWKRTGIGTMVEGRLADLENVAAVLIAAQAKLIQNQGLIEDEIVEVNGSLVNALSGVESFRASLRTSLNEVEALIAELQAQDAKTWDQLMNGAEYHLALLDTREAQDVIRLQKVDADLYQSLDVAYQNNVALSNYVEYIRVQYMYYFWMLTGALASLTLLFVVVLIKHARNRTAH